MKAIEGLLHGFLESDESFGHSLRSVIKDELGISVKEFAKVSGIPPSTVYKLISCDRQPTLKTLRAIFRAVREIEGRGREKFIGIIAARAVIEKIVTRKITLEGEVITVREYSASTLEDAIIAAVSAERDGASAVVCAPIVAITVEKILTVPVINIMPGNSVVRAIKEAARRTKLPPRAR